MSEIENKKLTKQEIYQKIRESSKEEYILSEMIRLGFWDNETKKPTQTESFIQKRSLLQKELRALGKEIHLYQDPEKALQELHKLRKKEALENREINRLARNQQRYEKALHWYNYQQKNITYLGDVFYFTTKNNTVTDKQRLIMQQLPIIENEAQLASCMGIKVSELKFLSFKRSVSLTSHYHHFLMPKKTGGVRQIAAPMPRLKRAQYWVLENILNPIILSGSAHGFVTGRSIISNAKPHVGNDLVINLDLKDFFPSIGFGRVKGVFKNLGYCNVVSTILTSICTESEIEQIEMDEQIYHVATSDPKLPQGAPTSPAITNILCRKLDKRIKGAADSLEFNFTRYADDLTFSANNKDDSAVQKLLWRIRSIIKDEGFTINDSKTRLMRKHKHQEVTGITVNKKLNVDRKTVKRFRALLFQMDKDGPENKQWGKGELFASISGYANFVAMVNPEKGIPFQQQVIQLKRKYSQPVKGLKITKLNKKLFRIKSANGEHPIENWWIPADPKKPQLEKTAIQLKQEKLEEKKIKNSSDTASSPIISQSKGPMTGVNNNKLIPKWMLYTALFLALLLLRSCLNS